jgi:hypothetical protein
MTKTEFKPVLIFTDEERTEKNLKQAENNCNQINEKLKSAIKYLGVEVSEKEQLEILENGVNSFLEIFRKQFQFPKATDDFNVKALGKEANFEQAKKEVSGIDILFKSYGIVFKNGIVEISEPGKIAIEENSKSYTQNEKQNEVYDFAVDICKKLNEAHTLGFIDNSNKYQIENNFNILKIPVYGQDKSFIPNKNEILSYKNDGSKQAFY